MQDNKQTQLRDVEPVKGSQHRWLAVSALLLAIGAILHLATPSIGGISPNWTIAMYSLAINLTRPTIGQALGIGFVAGAINVPTSKSAFPYGNLVSETVGAVVCAILVHAFVSGKLANFRFRPAVTTFFTTIASGMTFITILKFAMNMDSHVYFYVLLPVVLGSAAANTVITQLLYYPAERLFRIREEGK